MSEDIINIIIGIFIGAVVMMCIWFIIDTNQDEYHIEKVTKAQQDCKIKEYYYMDEHRDYCDKLEVNPNVQ